ncbi:NAD-dependent epimerase/dehydratase family protein [Halorhodospira halochloris]|uniref:NAD-dependent epimerase/dehydratase family protein n=1 Tax=Halorhodospira halochloris TaxID=1052 RepID=UPI001EE8A7D8|nr:NAD-dependent epimerase/dehydratase family protein [Halorhodospira halochloris]MCG5548896.1 NAD-dependent epimerase/dehydratase [Halorhodospira halochloris]
MIKALILGGGGFIGINIARRLLDDGGYTITLADKGYRGRLEEYFDADERAELTVIEDDFTDPRAYAKLANHYDYVYMMAAIVGVNRTLEHPEEVIRVNTALTHYTLEWLQRAEVGRVVFASSSENYAASTDLFDAPIPTPETVPLPGSDQVPEELGYEPQVPWREGVERTVRWYRDFFAAGRQPDDIGFEPPERFTK